MKRIASVLLFLSMICASSSFADDSHYDINGKARTYQKDRRFPELRFHDNSLVDVIDFCRDISGANIHVDWTSIADAKVTKDTRVSFKVKDKTLPEVLQLLIDSGLVDKDPKIKLAFYDDGKLITIATVDSIASYKKDHPVTTTGPSDSSGK